MADQKLVDYVNQSRQTGMNDEQIRQALFGAGWNISEVNEVLNLTMSISTPLSYSKIAASLPRVAEVNPHQVFVSSDQPKRKSHRILIFVVLIFILLLVLGGGLALFYFKDSISTSDSSSSKKFNTFSNRERGYEIQYPADWIISTSSVTSKNVLVIGSSAGALVTPVPQGEAFIYVSPEGGNLDDALKSFGDQKVSVADYNKTGTNKITFSAKEPEKIMLGGYEAVKFVYDISSLTPGSDFNTGHAIEYVIQDKNIPYVVYRVSMSTAKVSQKYEMIFEQVVQTFKIQQKEWQTYKDKQGRFVISYPPFWEVSEAKPGEPSIVSFIAPRNSSMGGKELVSVNMTLPLPLILNLPNASLDSVMKNVIAGLKKNPNLQNDPSIADIQVGKQSAKKIIYLLKNSKGSITKVVQVILWRGRYLVTLTYGALADEARYELIAEKMFSSLNIDYAEPKAIPLDTSRWRTYADKTVGYSIQYPGNIKPYESLDYGEPESVSFSFSIPSTLTPTSDKDANTRVSVEKWGKKTCGEHLGSTVTSLMLKTTFAGVEYFYTYGDILLASTGGMGYQEIYISPILKSDHCYRIEMNSIQSSLNDGARNEAHSILFEMMKSLKLN